MAGYRFLTTWLLDAPVERVWDVLHDAARWPEWWRGVERTEVLGEDLWVSTWRGQTASTWDWDVATTSRWMNAFGPAARPVFAWNHYWVMRRGAEGLARRLGCRLIAAT